MGSFAIRNPLFQLKMVDVKDGKRWPLTTLNTLNFRTTVQLKKAFLMNSKELSLPEDEMPNLCKFWAWPSLNHLQMRNRKVVLTLQKRSELRLDSGLPFDSLRFFPLDWRRKFVRHVDLDRYGIPGIVFLPRIRLENAKAKCHLQFARATQLSLGIVHNIRRHKWESCWKKSNW